MAKDPKDAYKHFAHLNKFLNKDENYRNQNTSDIDNDMLKHKSDENIYKKSKSAIKQKGHIK
ncbi:hypothetical protein [Staphylococcus edaphicus]|uniref:Uncharacterized protein n=1 Tax=Staphylococcus edaphicus TaxID=1955013 RepID=A0A2C6WIS0_9STAP|nr:hypothetical protein [Staphylococcus edaphicus]PHK50678.1 hypothetical protein BTJ66_02230 [Staphylococcus edaphicus]UQW80652.1 hypothetical protein MNY58_08600 [Staphylococcus edaphicus]